jgi:L-asparaginase II
VAIEGIERLMGELGLVGGVPLVEAVRSGVVECVHHGSAIVLGPDGRPTLAVGSTDTPIFPRSSNKPLQASGMLRAGLDVDGADLAIGAASHNGEPAHVEQARSLLRRAGLGADALLCPPALPANVAARDEVLRAGRGPERIYMNCSGKHSAMLLTCVQAGWPTEDYVNPDHPLQQAIRATVEEFAGEKVAGIGVDGCGAPIFALTLAGLARAFAQVVTAPVGSPERRVADAMRAHPFLVGGTGREDTLLMQAVPGLLIKGGAAGVHAAALPDGSALAFKIDDGTAAARVPLLIELLSRLGVRPDQLAGAPSEPVFGGGRVVGGFRMRAGWLG